MSQKTFIADLAMEGFSLLRDGNRQGKIGVVGVVPQHATGDGFVELTF